ncbi:MAG TPA: hypothetical protein VMT70_16165 [Vicinamibacteria bacterium]|nr:hypothetical protein [Vicinamibacteria bacterium]
MKLNRMKPWRRLAALRAARRRGAELPPPGGLENASPPVPPLEPPDDDREFLPLPTPAGLRAEPA